MDINFADRMGHFKDGIFTVLNENKRRLISEGKKVYDFSSRVGLPRTDLMYDMKENIIYEYSLYNADYVHKEFVSLGYGGIAFINKEIAFVKTLEAPDLVDAYKNGNLKGKLKEIAASLDEESNPVLMIAKYKQKK